MTVLLQWNLDGYFKRLAELQQLIAEYDPIVIALQETHLTPALKPRRSKFKIFRYDHFNPPNNHACGRSALLVSTKYNSHPVSTLNTLQNIALSVNIPQLHPLPITFCSVYIPPSHNTSSSDISGLILSLPSPFILCGDFNAHSHTWGVTSNIKFRTNARRNIIDHLLATHDDLFLLNHPNTPTHLNSTSGTFSAIDLTLCSNSLTPKVTWCTHPDLCDSDHYPILINAEEPINNKYKSVPRWLTDKANWQLFNDITTDTSTSPTPLHH